jgi:hypothetical protein
MVFKRSFMVVVLERTKEMQTFTLPKLMTFHICDSNIQTGLQFLILKSFHGTNTYPKLKLKMNV